MAAVLVGGLIGLASQKGLPAEYGEIAQAAIGIGTLALATRMFLATRYPLVPIGSLIAGGLLGHFLYFQAGMDEVGKFAAETFGGNSTSFQYSFVASSILFCVGPMTLLGCLQDGLEGRIELLGLKSVLDGISSVFFAAAYGPGVLLSAATVLVVQGALTLGARRFKALARRREVLDEISATGGLVLVALALGLLKLRQLPTADYLPALVVAGALAWLVSVRRPPSGPQS